jgi:hypothetical protein
MSKYESDPAGIGVGKTYGEVGVGGVSGVLKNEGSEYEVVVKLNAGELTRPIETYLPPYTKILSVTPVVKTALAGGVKIKVGASGTATTSAIATDTPGVGSADATLTGLNPRATVADGAMLIVTPEAAALAATTGEAILIVSCQRM